jgi:transcription initiation factor IIE alpha subunit
MFIAFEDQTKEIQRLQAKIDALMLEYCPNEMTGEQTKKWEASQVSVPEGDEQQSWENTPYCIECGSERLAFQGTYANGGEWKCKVCNSEFMW